MKVRSSLRSLKVRHKDCRIVRRKGKVYVINKTNPRFKARQGSTPGLPPTLRRSEQNYYAECTPSALQVRAFACHN